MQSFFSCKLSSSCCLSSLNVGLHQRIKHIDSRRVHYFMYGCLNDIELTELNINRVEGRRIYAKGFWLLPSLLLKPDRKSRIDVLLQLLQKALCISLRVREHIIYC